MRGNTDRRGPRRGHAKRVLSLRQDADRAEGNAIQAAAKLREVLG